MKKIILGIIIGVIISGTVGVIAATIVSSTIVTYQDKTVNNALDELYDNVNLLKTKVNAEANQILTGKKVIVKGQEITGTMANRGKLNWNPSSSTTYTVPAGYYSGGTLNSSGSYNAGYSAGKSAVPSFWGRSYGAVAFDFDKITSVTVSGSFIMYGSSDKTNWAGQGSYSNVTVTKNFSGYRYIKLTGDFDFTVNPKK